MGTAPTDRQPPVMPDAVVLVEDSLALLMRLGMPDRLAMATITQVARAVWYRLGGTDWPDSAWLMQVIRYAEHRAAALTPSHTDSRESGHADGTGS